MDIDRKTYESLIKSNKILFLLFFIYFYLEITHDNYE